MKAHLVVQLKNCQKPLLTLRVAFKHIRDARAYIKTQSKLCSPDTQFLTVPVKIK